MYVEENVVAISARRHAHAVKMQIRWIIRQLISEAYSHYIAKARPEHRRHIRSVVKKTRECEIAELHPTGRRSDHGPENAIFTANFRWAAQRLPPNRLRSARPRQPRARFNERDGRAENIAGSEHRACLLGGVEK